jgi:hypothetical protein
MLYEITRDWQRLDVLTGIPQGAAAYITNAGYVGDVVMVAKSPTKPDVNYRGEPITPNIPWRVIQDEITWVRYERYDNLYISLNRKKTVNAHISAEASIIPQNFPSNLYSDAPAGFERLTTETLVLSEKYITDGIAFEAEWNATIPVNASVYAQFLVPAGYYMALTFRQIITEESRVFYYVYDPSSGYIINTVGEPIKNSNLRNDSNFSSSPISRVTLTTTPEAGSGGVAGNKADKDKYSILSVPTFGVVGAGNRSTGSLSNNSISRLIAPESEFLLELYNNGSGTSDVQLALVYAFIPESLVYPPVT